MDFLSRNRYDLLENTDLDGYWQCQSDTADKSIKKPADCLISCQINPDDAVLKQAVSVETPNTFSSKCIYVGLLSRSTPTLLQLNKMGEKLKCDVHMTLKIQSDGTRFAFFNFQNLRAADTGMKKLENFRRCMLASGDLSLFENYTKIRYSDRRPIPTRLDECRSEDSVNIQSSEFESRDGRKLEIDITDEGMKIKSVFVGFVKPTVTHEMLNEIGQIKLWDCGFFGVSLSFYWPISPDPLKSASCHAVFVFASFEGAERAMAKLKRMKKEDSCETGPIFTERSRLGWGKR